MSESFYSCLQHQKWIHFDSGGSFGFSRFFPKSPHPTFIWLQIFSPPNKKLKKNSVQHYYVKKSTVMPIVYYLETPLSHKIPSVFCPKVKYMFQSSVRICFFSMSISNWLIDWLILRLHNLVILHASGAVLERGTLPPKREIITS